MANTKKPLEGKVAVVTGAGQSIGRAHALRLAEEGAKVIVNDLGGKVDGTGADAALAERVVDEIRALGGEAIANGDSVATMAGAKRIVESALDRFVRIDILINNAGIFRPNMIQDATEEDFDLLMAVHVKGTFATVRHVAPHFIAQRSGVIVNTGSDSGLGQYGNSIYGAAKEAIAGFTRSIARDLGPYNVRANLIRPGARSRMVADPKMAGFAEEAELKHGFPAGGDIWATRMTTPETIASLNAEYVADTAVWLCTDAASHINGQCFRIMGPELSLVTDPLTARSIYHQERWDLAAFSSPFGQSLHGHPVNRYLPAG
jgi:3-oxoacyl-[acyl-carrier protein] reductase